MDYRLVLGGMPVFLAWYGIGVALVLIENEDLYSHSSVACLKLYLMVHLRTCLIKYLGIPNTVLSL